MEFLPDCPTLEPLIAATPAVTITIGGRFPDGTHCDAGNILIGSGEAD